jgi:hypothetical protein
VYVCVCAGVYQYVVIRTLCAFIACVLEQYHLFAEGSYATDKVSP